MFQKIGGAIAQLTCRGGSSFETFEKAESEKVDFVDSLNPFHCNRWLWPLLAVKTKPVPLLGVQNLPIVVESLWKDLSIGCSRGMEGVLIRSKMVVVWFGPVPPSPTANGFSHLWEAWKPVVDGIESRLEILWLSEAGSLQRVRWVKTKRVAFLGFDWILFFLKYNIRGFFKDPSAVWPY